MFKQGDFIMYSSHGVCFIDEVSEKTINKEKIMHYTLHPINENKLKIITPVDNKTVKMRAIMEPALAEIIIASISDCNEHWIIDKKQRDQAYTKILKEGKPSELAQIIYTSTIEENERRDDGQKISSSDKKHLEDAEQMLYCELSLSLGIEMFQIKKRIGCMFL